jgi:hypothetical protein
MNINYISLLHSLGYESSKCVSWTLFRRSNIIITIYTDQLMYKYIGSITVHRNNSLMFTHKDNPNEDIVRFVAMYGADEKIMCNICSILSMDDKHMFYM